MAEIITLAELEERLSLFRANAALSRKSAEGMISTHVREAYLTISGSWDRLAEGVETTIDAMKKADTGGTPPKGRTPST